MYINNIFPVEPKTSSLIFDTSSGVLPQAFHNFVVSNVGRAKVQAQLLYGTAFGWIGTADDTIIDVTEQKTLENGGRPYYRLGLKIVNDTDTRAIVYASYTDGTYPNGNTSEINVDYDKIIKGLVVFGVKFIPYAGPTVSGLLGAFWPENRENVWVQIRNKVKDLVDTTMLETIDHILSGDIRHYQERIKVLESQLDPKNLELSDNIRDYYMNLAQDMIGLEFKFTFPENEYIAFAMLPLYSTVVMMKMNYYAIGVNKAQGLGITDDDVEDVKNFATTLIEGDSGVITYLYQMYKDRLDDIYSSVDVRDVYNAMMNTRSYIAVNGLEYIPLWKGILQDFSTSGTTYVDTISYSEFHGRVTPNLCKEATPELSQEPLTPKLINERRNKLSAVELHIWRIDNGEGAPKIGGIKVFFESGDSYIMGTSSNETNYVNFDGAFLDRVKVGGNGALDTFTFYFSDGREETFGTPSDNETYYELKDHHIASMFLSNDSEGLAGQAANFAVSFEQNY